MRILFLNPSGQLGGAERSLLDILASLRSARPDWRLDLVASDDGPLVDRARALGAHATVLRFPDSVAQLGDAAVRGPAGDRVSRSALIRRMLFAVPATFVYVSRLRRLLRDVRPDVVHTNGFKMHLLGLWAADGRVPVVWHIHDYVSARPVMSRLLRLYRARTAAIIANSESVKKDVRTTLGEDSKVYRVYNGVDTAAFSPSGDALDLDQLSGLERPESAIVRVGLVATLGRWKGHAVFLQALAALDPTLPVRFYVIGGALYQTGGSQYSLEDLQDLARKLGLDGRIGFTGFVDEPAKAIRALDIVVHASTQPEPFGLVVIEAMSCGRALVASEAGGSVELFRSGVDAVGYPPGDVEALADRITELVADPELRKRLGVAGREAAVERFDRAFLADALIPVYERAIRGE